MVKQFFIKFRISIIVVLSVLVIVGLISYFLATEFSFTYEEDMGTPAYQLTSEERSAIEFIFRNKYRSILPGAKYALTFHSLFEPKNPDIEATYLIRGSLRVFSPWGWVHYTDTGENSWRFVLAKHDRNREWQLIADVLCCMMGEEWY